jgi:hypothetical protein
MTMTAKRLKTLVLGPQDYRLREPLNVLGEPGLVKLAGADTAACWRECVPYDRLTNRPD